MYRNPFLLVENDTLDTDSEKDHDNTKSDTLSVQDHSNTLPVRSHFVTAYKLHLV